MENKIISMSQIDPTSVTRSASIIRKDLNFPFDSRHSICRIYPDGTYFHSASSIPNDQVYDAIAYNIIFRNESSILVDDIIVHVGKIDKSTLDGIVSYIIKNCDKNFICGRI